MNARFSVSAHTNSYRLSSDPQRETHVLILFFFCFSFLFFGGDLKQVLKQSHPTAPRMCHVKTESSLKRAQGSSSLAFSLCAFKGLKNKTLVKQPPGCRKAASTSPKRKMCVKLVRCFSLPLSPPPPPSLSLFLSLSLPLTIPLNAQDTAPRSHPLSADMWRPKKK